MPDDRINQGTDEVEKKEEIQDYVIVEPIPEYLTKFLNEYANIRRPSDNMVPIRVAIEFIDPTICADPGTAPAEIRILYKSRDWVAKRQGGGKDAGK